ncbi:MAG: hypothetical protein QQN63_14550 [Nitrosopumilus sp.]
MGEQDHRKLADRLCGIYAANPKRDNRPIFAAVLASEGVVDPETYKRLEGKYWEQTKVASEAEQQLAALRSKVAEGEKHLKVECLNAVRTTPCGPVGKAINAALDALRSTGDSDGN